MLRRSGASRDLAQRIPLTAGRSTVLSTDFEIVRIAVTNPAVADAVVVQPREVLIDGKAPGTVSLIVWGSTDRRQYDIVVEPAVTHARAAASSAVSGRGHPRQPPTTMPSFCLAACRATSVSLRAAEIAAATSSKAKVVNLLQLPGGAESQQVLLQVRFAEVSRHGVARARREPVHESDGHRQHRRACDDRTVPAAGVSESEVDQRERRLRRRGDERSKASSPSSDLLNIFLFSEKVRSRRRDPGASEQRPLPESRRAEPDRL